MADSRYPRQYRDDESPVENRREHIIEQLTHHYAHDALTTDEFEMRVELANQAQTLPALLDLVADLPVVAGFSEATRFSEAALPAVPQKITSIMAENKYRGDWVRSNTITALGVMTSVRMDFCETRLPANVIDVKLTCVMGEVVIVVPPDVFVECHVTPIMGSQSIKGIAKHESMRDETLRKDNARAMIRVSGLVVMGELVIKYQK